MYCNWKLGERFVNVLALDEIAVKGFTLVKKGILTCYDHFGYKLAEIDLSKKPLQIQDIRDTLKVGDRIWVKYKQCEGKITFLSDTHASIELPKERRYRNLNLWTNLGNIEKQI